MWFGGRRRDGGDGGFDNRQWEGDDRDVLEGNVASRISSKDLFDERVLGGCGKEVFFFIFTIGGLVGAET